MALHELLSMIPHEVAGPKRPVVSRWTETPLSGDWEPEPAYGAFVDEQGRVVSGSRPARAFLESDDPRNLQLVQGVEWALSGCEVFFLDWGRQPLSWEEIFALWEAWDSQGMIADCGAVSVRWDLAGRWTAPSWVAFRDGFDGAPLSLILREVRTVPLPASAPVPSLVRPADEPESFLVRASRLRGDPIPARSSDVELPMLPFTLKSLHDAHFAWPAGVA